MDKRRFFIQFSGIISLVMLVFGLSTQLILQEDQYYLVPLHFALAGIFLVIFIFGGGLGSISLKGGVKKARFGIELTLYSFTFLAVLVAANIIFSRHLTFFYDSTEQKVFSLAPQTQEILSTLPAEVEVRAFFIGGLVEPQRLADLLDRLSKESRNFKLQIIDPEREPLLAEKLGIRENAVLHFQMHYADKLQQVQLDRNIDEQAIVDALIKLGRTSQKRVGYISGHGQPSLYDVDSQGGFGFMAEAIQAENIGLEEIVIGQQQAIPASIDAVILASPERSLLPTERQVLLEYLQAGGKALFLHELLASDDIRELAEEFHIIVGQDAIVDKFVSPIAGTQYGLDVMVTSYGPHRLTERFEQATLFSIVSSVSRADTAPAGYVTEIAFSRAGSWAESSLDNLLNELPIGLNEHDLQGPVPLAAVYENPETGTRLAVVGDANFISNAFISQLYNRDFFLNTINWLIGEESGITIRARTLRDSRKLISAEQFSVMFIVTGVIIPEFILLVGLAVWWRRRLE